MKNHPVHMRLRLKTSQSSRTKMIRLTLPSHIRARVQHLDLNFGAAALHIAVPPISTFTGDTSSGLSPSILNDQLVFVIACSDQKLRLVTWPLNPPSPLSKLRQDIRSTITANYAGHGKWGETVLELTASLLPADGVSLTFTNAEKASNADGDRSLRSTRSTSTSGPAGSEWHILVASYSREGPGLLTDTSDPNRHHSKGQNQLYSVKKSFGAFTTNIPLLASNICNFNPNISSPWQSTRLLVADKTGACRIYDCEPSHASSSISSENLGSTTLASQYGSWLLTMYPGFPSSKSDTQNVASGTSLATLAERLSWTLNGRWAGKPS